MQGLVQSAMTKSGKGAMQGAVERGLARVPCCAELVAVAKSGNGAVQDALQGAVH